MLLQTLAHSVSFHPAHSWVPQTPTGLLCAGEMENLDLIPARQGTQLLEMSTQQQPLTLTDLNLFPKDLAGPDSWKTSHHERGTLQQHWSQE